MGEVEQMNEVKLVHCSYEDQLADVLTKPLSAYRFENLRKNIGIYSIEAKEEC